MKHIINKLLSILNIVIIYRQGHAYGEQLYMSSLVNKIKLNKKIILLTTCVDLFRNNPDISILIDINKNNFFIKIIVSILNKIQGTNIILFYPFKYQHFNNKNYLNFNPKNKHVIEINSERSKVKFNKNDIKNFFYFSKKEEIELSNKYSYLKNFKLIQSETKDSFTNNKNWDTKKLQEIINFFPKNQWVQIGLEDDYKFENVINLTGKTSIRDLAFLIKKAEYIICLEGFFAHLSSCFNTKAYVIYSGIVPLDNLIYENIIPITKSKNLKCSPCYLIGDCNMKEKYCTNNISALDVINTIEINDK